MTLTILTLPTTSFAHVDLEPTHLIAVTRARGGYTSEITSGDPVWGGSLTTTPLTERQLRAWEAFIALATERMLPFDLVHPSKRLPSAYSDEALAALPWDGSATVTSLADLRSPVMAGIPVGVTLRVGDRLSVAEGDYVSHRVVAEDLTVSSGTAQSVPVTPRLPLGRFTTSATVAFKDSVMRLRVVPNTWAAPLEGGQPMVGSFQVVEAPR